MDAKLFNGERLRKARIYNGLTLTELADRMEISKQSLSLYENGKNIPDYQRVHALANQLGFPFDFFFQEDKVSTRTETTYFRSQATATKKDRTAQSVKLEFVARMYEVLWNFIDFPVFDAPDVEFTGFDTVEDCNTEAAINEMETVAQTVRKAWGLGNSPIKNLQYLLEQHGILVTVLETNEDKIDAFSQRTLVENSDVYLIALAMSKVYECRIRFDMAHELGHIMLHPWSEDLDTISKEDFKARERQANMFASAFLLPRETFGSEVAQYPTNLDYYQFLKKRWKVSIQAMVYRAHQLKIITSNQYQYLMRQISKNGWKTQEPGDVPYVLNESIFQGAIDLLFENNILSPNTLMREFRINGISLYASTIEELLHLRKGTLASDDKVIPLFQLKKSEDSGM